MYMASRQYVVRDIGQKIASFIFVVATYPTNHTKNKEKNCVDELTEKSESSDQEWCFFDFPFSFGFSFSFLLEFPFSFDFDSRVIRKEDLYKSQAPFTNNTP